MLSSIKKTLNKILPSSFLYLLRVLYYKLYSLLTYRKGRASGFRKWTQSNFNKTDIVISNDLDDYFENHKEGHGIWKWKHYFEIYDSHFNKFRNEPVTILEIGIYSGGSLEMWKTYFGNKCNIIGLDIEESCKVYNEERVSVYIGDQADRSFWKKLRKEVKSVDIIIDDGGHLPHQQLVTLEESLDMLSPGGVYLCEDITGKFNPFLSYLDGLKRALHDDSQKHSKGGVQPNFFQKMIKSVTYYPFVVVLEKRDRELERLHSPKRGTIWQPFFE